MSQTYHVLRCLNQLCRHPFVVMANMTKLGERCPECGNSPCRTLTVKGETRWRLKQAKSIAAEIRAMGKKWNEWQPYAGEYEKEFYDIRLVSGVEHYHCWPNAGTFHCNGATIDGETVTHYRVSEQQDL